MKHLKVMLVAALIAAPLAPRAEEPQKVTFDVSGWLILNGFFNRGDLDARETSRYARLNDPDLDQRQFGMAARQSRIRAAVGVPADGLLAGATLKGLLEADFGGTAASADTVMPRMRHYFVSSTWKNMSNFSLLVGQTWGVASNTYFPESNAHYLVPRFGGAGFLYRRAPQVRASVDVPVSGPLALAVTAAALTPGDGTVGANLPATANTATNQSVGNDAAFPNLEARVAAKYSQNGKPVVEAGLWTHYGREKYDSNVTGLTDVTAASSGFGLDVRLTFPYVQVLGQVFTGENLDVLASIAGTQVSGYAANPDAAFFKTGVVIDNTDPSNPKAKGMKTQGGFLQLVMSPVKRVQILLGAGMENPDDATLKLDGAGPVPDGYITRNTQYSAGTIIALSNRWKVSLEATRYLTTVSDAAGENGRDVLPATQFEVGSLVSF
jgi:hypothetical protein